MLRHHPLVPSQYKRDGPWAGGKRGYSLAVWRWGSLLWDSLLSSFEEMSCWNEIPPKKGKDELESLGACHRS